jgi:bifunctional oligoribonuclease and PAP phosphatase NrnA
MQHIQQIFSELTEPKNVVITMHQKPDGDAMGSTLGLYHFLESLGHNTVVISPTNWADFLNWMPGVDTVMDYESKALEADALILNADYVFCLDFNTLSRTKRMKEVLEITRATRILIDHHREPAVEWFAYGDSNIAKSSTCEMVYDFIVQSPYANNINATIGECLYTGLMTDTGSFRFPSTTASVHRMVAHLLDLGVQHSKIHENIFDTNSETRLRFIGHVLSNRLEVFYEYNTVLISIPAADIHKYGIKTGDTEGLVNYPLSIEGIKFAAIVIDRVEERKWSFRSKGDFDVNTFAREHFNGGGHFNAAGGGSYDSFDKTVTDFKTVLKTYRDKLTTYTF